MFTKRTQTLGCMVDCYIQCLKKNANIRNSNSLSAGFAIHYLVIVIGRWGNGSSVIVSWCQTHSNSSSTSKPTNSSVNRAGPWCVKGRCLIPCWGQQTCVICGNSSVRHSDKSEKYDKLKNTKIKTQASHNFKVKNWKYFSTLTFFEVHKTYVLHIWNLKGGIPGISGKDKVKSREVS